MAIESISGHKKYRISPQDPRVVQVQEKHGARWLLFWECRTPADATELVLQLARNVRGEEHEE